MEGLVKDGLVKSIGVSNFNRKQIDRLLAMCEITPAVNQLEASVNWMNEEVIAYNRAKGIQVVGYAPFGSPAYSK